MLLLLILYVVSNFLQIMSIIVCIHSYPNFEQIQLEIHSLSNVHNHNYTKFAFPKNLTTPLQQKNIDHGNSNIITIYGYDTKSPSIVQKP
jgi:hypothetical protein